MYQGHRLDAVAHGDAESYHLAVDGVQSRVACTGCRVTGAPLCGAAEIAMRDEAVVFECLVDFDGFAFNEVLILAASHTRPRHTVVRQLTHGDRRFLGEYPGHLLVGAPVRAANRILEVHVRTVAFRFHTIAERRLHAALRCTAVAASWWYQRQYHRVLSGRGRFNRAAFAGKTAADHEYIGRYELRRHDATSVSRNSSGGDIHPASTSSVMVPRPSTTQKMNCSMRCR